MAPINASLQRRLYTSMMAMMTTMLLFCCTYSPTWQEGTAWVAAPKWDDTINIVHPVGNDTSSIKSSRAAKKPL